MEIKQVNNKNKHYGGFKKGVSGNPNGRPKKEHSITEAIRGMMDEKPEVKKALAQKILQMALQGDITAIKTLWNYIDGMPKQDMGIDANMVIEIVRKQSEISG